MKPTTKKKQLFFCFLNIEFELILGAFTKKQFNLHDSYPQVRFQTRFHHRERRK